MQFLLSTLLHDMIILHDDDDDDDDDYDYKCNVSNALSRQSLSLSLSLTVRMFFILGLAFDTLAVTTTWRILSIVVTDLHVR